MVLNDSKKCRGRRKPRVVMDEFCDVVNKLAMVDVKPHNGWFT